MTSKPRRLNWAAILLFAFNSIKERFLIFLPFVFLIFDGEFSNLVVLIVALIIISILLFFSWLKWFRFTYSLVGDDLKIEHGVIVRKQRTISKYRIQSVKLNQNILHRLLGLTGMQVETAGSDLDVDANLVALKLSDADNLRKQLKTKEDHEKQDETYEYDYALENKLPKYEASYKRLFAFGSTSGGFSIIILVFLFIISEGVNYVPEQYYDQTTTWLLNQGIPIIIFLVLLVLAAFWFIGVFGSVIKHGDFTIVRYEHELYISRGLLEKKQMTIPLNRIQAVSFKQNPLRLPFNFGSLTIVIAGGEVDPKGQTQTIIFPFIKQTEIKTFMEKILPEYLFPFEELQPISRRYFYFKSIIYLLVSIILTIAIVIFFSSFWWIGLVIFLLQVGYQWIQYRLTRTGLTDEQLTIQLFSRFSKETVCLRQDRIQALEHRQSLLQHKIGITNFKASVLDNFLGKHYTVSGLSHERAAEISEWYSYRDAYNLEDLLDEKSQATIPAVERFNDEI